jgi:hypothetical protein
MMYMDFYTYWNMRHIQEDHCDFKDIMTSCSDFSFLEDDSCTVFVSYSPCDETHFVCEITRINEYNDYEIDNCVHEFENIQFWDQMRNEDFWRRPENEQYKDFYFYWNARHYGGSSDDECEWRELQVFCQDFDFLRDEECSIGATYNPCITDSWAC